MSTLIFLNTALNNKNGMTYDALFDLYISRLTNFKGFTLSLLSCEFPVLVPNINVFNNTFAITVTVAATGVAQTYTFTVGASTGVVPAYQQYDSATSGVTSLGAAMTTALASPTPALAGAYVGCFTGATFVISNPTASSSSTYYSVFTGAAAVATWNYTLSPNTITSPANSLVTTYAAALLNKIGFVTNLTSNTATPRTITADSPADLSGTKYVDIITNLGTVNINNNLRSNVLARVPITVPYAGVNFYSPLIETSTLISTPAIDQMRIYVVDDKGNPYQSPLNAPFSLTLKLLELQ